MSSTNKVETFTNNILNEFQSVSTGLFKITGRFQEVFEQGIYGVLLAKPSKRMRIALAVDREILVVVSTFPDQQQRTIKYLKHKIDESDGRFEATIAVVIHLDPDGGAKLKNWGRDHSIAILSINWSEAPEDSESLEQAICSELYSHDPFDVTGPVSDDANFYGRRDEAIDLARKLQGGQIRSCLGIRKIGKTSIINRIIQEIEAKHKCLCLMIDCSRDDVWSMDAARLLDSIAYSIAEAQGRGLTYSSLRRTLREPSIEDAGEALRAAVADFSDTVVLVFDEIDYITPGSPTNANWSDEFNRFWRNLRAVYQEIARNAKNMSLLIGGVSAYWFTVESIKSIENAALAFVPEEYLSPMPTGATIAMIKRLGRVAGLQFEESGIEYIAKSTANIPYWSRKACSYIHRKVPIGGRPCQLTSARIKELVDRFVSEEGSAIAEVALQHLFRVHPELKEAASLLQKGRVNEVRENLKRPLRRYGLIDAHSNEISGSMLNSALAAVGDVMISKEVLPVAVESGVSRETEIGQWAEEIASLGKRRNILEKRLRAVVVNFIRFNAISSGGKNNIKDRVLAILPENQRETLKHSQVEDIVNKYNWTDLSKLVIKEWNLIGSIFGDQNLFKSNGDVINDRYDAHAKDADLADFALYRRALNWLEEKMSKLQ